MSMKRDEVIERFCDLASDVGRHVYNSQYAHDCFCGSSFMQFISGEFRFDTEIMEFVEAAVYEKIARSKVVSFPRTNLEIEEEVK